MNTVLALDQGTTGSTALVIGEDGGLLGRGYRELPRRLGEWRRAVGTALHWATAGQAPGS